MPTNAVTHIQKIAPGPPRLIATATPEILPKPKVPESASINAGDQVPTVTQSSTSDTDRVTNSIQYVTTGIQVAVTPTINARGLINLSITMSSSAAKLTDGFEVATPTITNRTITTNIYSADGQTVALGGLIREDLDGTGNKVPPGAL